MKSTFVAFAAAALVALAGCGGESENMSAQYPPPPPVGTDLDQATSPEQGVAASEMPNAAPPDVQLGQQTEGEASAQAYAQPQAGDIQVGADASEYADTDPAALTDFRSTLDPYGTWVDDGTYGTVWVPSSTVVGNDFAPYVTAGHWAYDDDYVWVSDYEWGWAPFHYGRWVYIGGRGWGWIPGRTYAGAWVTWRYGYDDWGYVGWAPLPPAWYWHGGIAVGIGFVPPAPYVFCHSGYLFHPGVGGHIVTGAQVPVVASHTRPYVPAHPSVGGGGLPGGHAGAHPTVGGPSPKLLGINDGQIAHAPAQNRGLLHAQQFARPSTAQSLGARAPAQMGGAGGMNGARSATSFNGVPRGGPAGGAQSFNAPRSVGPSPSFGRNAPVATAPQYRGISPSPYHAPPAGPSYSPPRASAPSYSPPRASAPSYSAPRYSAPSYSAPHYSAPSYSAPHASAPSYSAPHYSAPSYSAPHYSAPSGGFHSGGSVSRPSGGGGGFHGAARGGGRR